MSGPSAGRRPADVDRREWLRVLIGAAVLWLVFGVVVVLTRNAVLVPAWIVLGTFAVPVTVVLWSLERLDESAAGQFRFRALLLLRAFALSGTAGLVLAASVEVLLLDSVLAANLLVSLVETLVAIGLVVLLARRLDDRTAREGMVFGAVVGAGFAAFESAGYAFQSLVRNVDDRPLLHLADTVMLRAVLAPFGHITWVALLGGALFAGAVAGRFRGTRRVVLTTAGVVALHAAWNASEGVAVMIARGLTGEGWHLSFPSAADWMVEPSTRQLLVFDVVYYCLLAVWAAVGVLWLRRSWSRSPSSQVSR